MENITIRLSTKEEALAFILDRFEEKLVFAGMANEAAASARLTMENCLWACPADSGLSQIDVVQCISASFEEFATLLALTRFSDG